MKYPTLIAILFLHFNCIASDTDTNVNYKIYPKCIYGGINTGSLYSEFKQLNPDDFIEINSESKYLVSAILEKSKNKKTFPAKIGQNILFISINKKNTNIIIALTKDRLYDVSNYRTYIIDNVGDVIFDRLISQLPQNSCD